jgi:hypothetical protein
MRYFGPPIALPSGMIRLLWGLLLPLALGAQTASLAGTVVDPSGASIPGAHVMLQRLDGPGEWPAETGLDGAFRFAGLASGRYEVRASREQFQPATARLRVGPRPAPPLRLVLEIATLTQELTVADPAARVSAEAAGNVDTVRLDAATLADLPVLGNDILGAVSRFLDASALGAGGVTLVVDGMETAKLGVTASAIQEVRINQNPYSAEFFSPGRGRVEIITKQEAPAFHGEFNFRFRDHHLDARNAFASYRPPEQRRIFEGHFTGPLGKSKKTSFLVSAQREEEDLHSLIYARTVAGLLQEQFPNPQRDTELYGRVIHRASGKSTFTAGYEYEWGSESGADVGGFSLPESASDRADHYHAVLFRHQWLPAPKLINMLHLRWRLSEDRTVARRPGERKIVVVDAFTSGGAQSDRRESDSRGELTEVLSLTRGPHVIKAGAAIREVGRRSYADWSNREGTFSFSSLEDYLAGRPFSFTRQEGDPRVAFFRQESGGFLQDDIRVRASLSLGVGLRYDRQTYPADHNNFAPRLGFAWAPGRRQRTVLRGGAGVFYDRVGSGPPREVAQFDGRRLQRLVLSDPGYPEPFSGGAAASVRPPSVVRFAPDLRSSYLLQYSLGVERQVREKTAVTLNYTAVRGKKMFRSRDLNAPTPPQYARPDAALGVLRQIESSARLATHALDVGLRGDLSRFFNGGIRCTLGRAYNDTGGIDSLPADSLDLTGEWARADFDRRHRLELYGVAKAGRFFRLGTSLSLNSGAPYGLTTGRDDNRDGAARDRPAGVRRNSLEGPGSATLDLRCSRDFPLREKGPEVSVSLDAFNVFNRVNYSGYIGNLSSPFFGRPVAARAARRVQLSLRFEF